MLFTLLASGICSPENLSTITIRAHMLWEKDLLEIDRESLDTLLNIFDEIHNNYKSFREQCYSILDREVYNYYESIFAIALLKLSISIINKAADRSADNRVRNAISMFTDDERELVKEFERFSALDPHVVSPDLLAEYIVSRREGVYELVKEAVNKQYTQFSELIESWSGKYRLSNAVRRGLLIRYEARFRNIINAIKRLIEQQPAWIKRLFSDYEEAILSSAKIRDQFEQKVREVFEEKLKSMSSYIEKLEEERNNLIKKVEELSRGIATAESMRAAAEAEASKLREALQRLESRYSEVFKVLEKGLEDTKLLWKQLIEKEKELREALEREKESTAAREAIEAEVARLKQLAREYEDRIREYELEKNNLLLQLRTTEEKLSIIEKSARGELKGRLVAVDEAALLETIFIGKLRDKLEALPIKISTPWGTEVVDKWDDVKIYSDSVEDSLELPRNTRVMYTFRRRRLLGFGETRTINILGAYVVDVEQMRRHGVASEPASLEDILKVLRDAPRSAPGEKMFTIVGIASPTGWSESAIDYVTGKKQQLITKDVVVVLVDLVKNTVYYPSGVPEDFSEHLLRVFTVETNAEEENRVEKKIMDMCDSAVAKSPSEPVFPYTRLLEELKGVSPLSLFRVIYRLVDRRVIEVKRKRKSDTMIICRSYR